MPEFEGQSQEKPRTVQGEDMADARERRIDELREQCSDGSYGVDAAKLAAKIVDRHLENPTS